MKGVTSHITNTLNQEPNLYGLVKAVCKYCSWLKNCLSKSKKQRDLSIIHFNVRSLSKNKPVIEELLCELDNFLDILAISKTKLTDEKVNCAKIPNYNFVFSNLSTNAGGVAFYMLNKLHFTRSHYLESKTNDRENVFVGSKIKYTKKIVIGLLYRHPTSNFTEFQDKFTSILNQLNQTKQDYVICSDFNIDQIKLEKNSKINKYFNAVYAEGCMNLINKPTCITENSTSLLDHLYSI